MKQVEYFEFVSVIKNARIKVIVKKIEGGEPFFWSIIPFWKQADYGKRLYDGDPEID